MEAGSVSSVSVVIPCYRYGHFLDEAVHSVLDDQGDLEVRVLIIDDASSDGSADAAKEIAAREPQVEVVEHAVNKGHIATYNEGLLEWADGDYSVLLSADDRLTQGALRRAVDLLDAQPSVGFVYGNVIWFNDEDELPKPRTKPRGWSVWGGQQWLEQRFRYAVTGVISPEVVVRTSVQRRVGGYDPRLPHVGDQEMWLRLAADSDVGFVRGVDQAYYRRHTQNMSLAYNPLTDLCQLRVAFESVVERCSENLSDSAYLSDIVHRKLAWKALLAAARAYDRGRTADTPIDELVTFALDCWPEARTLALYRTLVLRRRLGPRAMRALRPASLPAAAVRKAKSSWVDSSWKAHG